MPRKPNDGPFKAPAQTPSSDSALPAAFNAALGGLPGTGKGLLTGKGVNSRPDQLNKARKPAGGPNRTAGPRKGHR